MEAVGLHAVVHHVHDPVVGACDPAQLPGRRGTGHHAQRGPAQRGSGPGPEEPGLDRRVQLRVGEEGGVVQGHHRGHRAGQRHRVVRTVQHVGPHPPDQPGQRGLLPGQPRGAGDHLLGDRQHLGVRGEPGVERGVPGLAEHHRFRTVGIQRSDQRVHITTDAATACGHRRRVDQHARLREHGGSLRRHAK